LIKTLLYAILFYALFKILVGVLRGLSAGKQASEKNNTWKVKTPDNVVDLCPDCGDILKSGHRCKK
jgi:hypothetical protein